MTESDLTFGEKFPQVEQVQRLWHEGRLEESGELLRAIPSSPEQLLLAAHQKLYESVAAEEKAGTEILDLTREAVALAPDEGTLLVAAALILFQAEEYREVQELLREIDALQPALDPLEEGGLAFLRGMMSWWLGRTHEVEALLRAAVEAAPDDPLHRWALDRFLVNKTFPPSRFRH